MSKMSEMTESFRVLEPEYEPDIINHREEEINRLKIYVFSYADRKPENIFIYGDSGVGKTLVVKKLWKEYTYNKANVIYVCAGDYGDLIKTLQALYYQVSNHPIKDNNPNPNTYALATIKNLPSDKYNILIIDEVDKIIKNEKQSAFLYPLLRSNKSISLLLIANYMFMKDYFSQPIQSSFNKLWIKFSNYNYAEISAIIKHRLDLLRYQYNKLVLDRISEATSPIGDARYAIAILRLAVMHSQMNKRQNEIKYEDVDWAIKELERSELSEEIEKLSDDGIILLYFIINLEKKDPNLSTFPNIYNLYMDFSEATSRRIITNRHALRILDRLSTCGILYSQTLHYERGKPNKYIFRGASFNTIEQIIFDNIKQRTTIIHTEVLNDILEKFDKQTRLR